MCTFWRPPFFCLLCLIFDFSLKNIFRFFVKYSHVFCFFTFFFDFFSFFDFFELFLSF